MEQEKFTLGEFFVGKQLKALPVDAQQCFGPSSRSKQIRQRRDFQAGPVELPGRARTHQPHLAREFTPANALVLTLQELAR